MLTTAAHKQAFSPLLQASEKTYSFITGPSLEGRAEAEESSGLAALVQGVGNQGLAHSEVKPLRP